jgi:hypothetical protein
MDNIVTDPNSKSSNILSNLKHLKNQGSEYSKYDTLSPNFDPDDSVIESFFTFKKFMFDKILIILIIGILAIFIMKCMDFM